VREGFSVEKFARRGEGRLPGLVGVRIVAVEHLMLVAELDIRPELLAPNGFLHAASVIALADTACGYGCIAHLPDGAENFTTIELKSNFLASARVGERVTCRCTPAHLGRQTHVWDAVVTNETTGRTIALFRCTQMVLLLR
jgi:uncharacterized protein (TIGR00369 family)